MGWRAPAEKLLAIGAWNWVEENIYSPGEKFTRLCEWFGRIVEGCTWTLFSNPTRCWCSHCLCMAITTVWVTSGHCKLHWIKVKTTENRTRPLRNRKYPVKLERNHFMYTWTQVNTTAFYLYFFQSFRLFLDIMGLMTHGYTKWWVNFQKDGSMTI